MSVSIKKLIFDLREVLVKFLWVPGPSGIADKLGHIGISLVCGEGRRFKSG